MTPRTFSEQDIHLALDGELPDEERPAFDVWLEASPDMNAQFVRYGDDRTKLREALEGAAHEPIPSRLMDALLANRETRTAASLWKFAVIAASLLVVGVLGGYLTATVTREDARANVAYEIMDTAINAHIMYANEKRDVVEVSADQADHLNGWLSNRVGIKLVAPDLKSQGFELVGGRLLPVGEKPAAQYMYQDAAGNRISLFVTRYDRETDRRYDVMQERGAEAHFWQEKGYGCAVTGTLPETRMTSLAKLAYREFIRSAAIQ